MNNITGNEKINKLITHIDGNCSLGNYESLKLQKLITEFPSSEDMHNLRDYIYHKLLNSQKCIQNLELVLLDDTMKKQEKRLNTYKAIFNGDFNFTLARWAYLLDLTDESKTFYDFIKNIGMYVDINNKNEFYRRLNEFILNENFDFDSYNVLMYRKDNPYPSNQKIENNFKSIKCKGENYTNELGIYGELCSFLYLEHELIRNGKDDLAKRSIWVAKELGDHFGFDQTSFDENEEELIMEVKTTNSQKFEKEKDNFYMTTHEYNVMKRLKKEYNYVVVRVYIDEQGIAELFYLKPNEDNSVEYGDIKYVPYKLKDKGHIEYKREPKKKIFKLN